MLHTCTLPPHARRETRLRFPFLFSCYSRALDFFRFRLPTCKHTCQHHALTRTRDFHTSVAAQAESEASVGRVANVCVGEKITLTNDGRFCCRGLVESSAHRPPQLSPISAGNVGLLPHRRCSRPNPPTMRCAPTTSARPAAAPPARRAAPATPPPARNSRSARTTRSHTGRAPALAAPTSGRRSPSPTRSRGDGGRRYDLLGLGQAMVDFSAVVDDAFVASVGAAKGGRR